MSEFFLERIERLERSVRRWRLVSVALGILLACSVACGGTFTTVLLMSHADQRAREEEAMMRVEEAREQAEQAVREAGQKGP